MTARCGVCLEECGEKNTATTECGHKTHLNCFIQALSTSDNCIYCRKTLNLRKDTLNGEFQTNFDLGNTILTASVTIIVYLLFPAIRSELSTGTFGLWCNNFNRFTQLEHKSLYSN